MELLNINKQKINLYVLGDVHIGSKNHNRTAFRKAVQIIKSDRYAK